MATLGTTATKADFSSTVTSGFVTDCPQCSSLCLGPSILPCGHLICRRCLRSKKQQQGFKLACRICRQIFSVPEDHHLTLSQLVQHLGTDPVMEQLVNLKLESEGRKPCSLCDSDRDATMVCQDCKESYCDACSDAHTKMAASEDHLMLLLPQTLYETCSSSLESSSDFAKSLGNTERLMARVKSRTVSHGESCDQQQWNQWMETQIQQLRAASCNRHKVISTLQDLVSIADQLLKQAEREEKVLNAYAACLPQYDVIKLSDQPAHVIILSKPDVTMEVKTETLERRLQDITKGSHSESVTILQKMVDEVRSLTEGHAAEVNTNSSITTKEETGSAASLADYPTPKTVIPLASDTPSHTHPPDPMKATPVNVFTITPATDDDREKPFTGAIASTQDGRLVMADGANNKVKVVELASPGDVTACVTVDFKPLSLAVLRDGLVALTTDQAVVCLLDLGETVTVTQIKTSRQYAGVIGSNSDDDTLIVSCCKNDTEPARVDVIDRGGDVMRTIADVTTIPGLQFPGHLCLADDHLLIADSWRDFVYRVSLESCRLVETVTHTALSRPSQLATDNAGNMYVASRDSQCVMVRSWRQGTWRRLLYGPEDSEHECFWPWGVCTTANGLLVVAWRKAYSHSVVSAYDLQTQDYKT